MSQAHQQNGNRGEDRPVDDGADSPDDAAAPAPPGPPLVEQASERMSAQEFEDVVGDALDRIPADLAEAMDNVVVLVQDEPDPEMLTAEDYDEAGLPTLLGLYDGVPLTERDEGWSMVLPDRILIFRGPLERWCTSREELEEEITVTVIHEVAHHFGIPDERLHELGWE